MEHRSFYDGRKNGDYCFEKQHTTCEKTILGVFADTCALTLLTCKKCISEKEDETDY